MSEARAELLSQCPRPSVPLQVYPAVARRTTTTIRKTTTTTVPSTTMTPSTTTTESTPIDGEVSGFFDDEDVVRTTTSAKPTIRRRLRTRRPKLQRTTVTASHPSALAEGLGALWASTPRPIEKAVKPTGEFKVRRRRLNKLIKAVGVSNRIATKSSRTRKTHRATAGAALVL